MAVEIECDNNECVYCKGSSCTRMSVQVDPAGFCVSQDAE